MFAKAIISAGLSIAAGLMVISSTSMAAGDVEKGKEVFKKCALCHTNEAGKNKLGPSLFGIVGRQSASVAGYSYSDAMKNFNKTWDKATLDTYIANPREVVPGTKMVFPGIKDKAERDALLDYLETLK